MSDRDNPVGAFDDADKDAQWDDVDNVGVSTEILKCCHSKDILK